MTGVVGGLVALAAVLALAWTNDGTDGGTRGVGPG